MASLFFCKIHEFCVRTQSGYQQFRKFYFRKSVHRSNSGHKIGFSKKEKSEIRSKNSKKMLEFSLKIVILQFFFTLGGPPVLPASRTPAAVWPPFFRTVIIFCFSSLRVISFTKVIKKQNFSKNHFHFCRNKYL